MNVFIIVGENQSLHNISARAAYSTRERAEAHLNSNRAMYFDDRAVIVELELDKEDHRATADALHQVPA